MAGRDLEIFAAWNRHVAMMLDPGNQERLPELLVRACETLLPESYPMAIVHGKSSQPVRLFDIVPDEQLSQHVEAYYAGAYLLDPYYRAGVGGIASGIYALRDIAPQGFRQSQYYRHYYRAARIADEVGLITHLHDGRFANLSFITLVDAPRFRKKALSRLAAVRPVIDRMLVNYWRDRAASESGKLHSQLEVALGMFGDSALTAREAEVVRLYLQGHSTRSIGERLGISTHTVSMHRKNAYAKLDVTSQYELFHMFIDSLTCFDPACPDDPLIRYLGKQGGRTDVGD